MGGTSVNSYLSQFVLILFNSCSCFGQFVLNIFSLLSIRLSLVNKYVSWSIRSRVLTLNSINLEGNKEWKKERDRAVDGTPSQIP